MDIAVFVVFVLFYLFAAVTAFLSQAHMFQLNSYSYATHTKWMGKNIRSLSLNFFAIGFVAMCIYCDVIVKPSEVYEAIIHILFVGAFAVIAVSNLPKKKAKTPLVFTARVKRMMVTYLVLAAVGAALASLAPILGFGELSYAILFAFYAINPLVLFLANLINAPAEAMVRRYYLKDALKILRSCPDLKIIGITGSYGKTSMKTFLTSILKQKYNVLMTPKNYNTPMGVVMTVRGYLRGYHEYFVCEMGAKKKGEIKELCDIVNPRDGIVTSIGPQHLESFKSMENIIETKMALAHNLSGGKAYLNIDNEHIRANETDGAVTYGFSEDADYQAKVISVSPKGTKFSILYPDGREFTFVTALLGAHNVQNFCGAVAIADHLGVSPEEIEEGIARVKPVPHRLEMSEKGNITVIDDAYNSNPAGAAAALDVLSSFDDYKIIVTPGMVELGELEEELNCELGKRIADVCEFAVLVGEKRAEPLLRGLLEKGYPDEKIYVARDINDAMNKVYSLKTDRKKVVLLENDLPDNY